MRNRILKKNNKGFTLVELIVCVAILAVVAAPLLTSFVTSANIEQKGRETNSATLAAQNIQETITGYAIDKVIDGSCFSDLSSSRTKQTAETGDICWKLSQVSAAGETYDAIVTLKGSVYDSASVPMQSTMDAVFSQPSAGSSTDPDTTAKAEAGSKITLSRTITVDITAADSADGKTVSDVLVTYTYKSTSGSSAFSTTYSYGLLTSAFEQKGAEPMNLYVMYNPFSSGTETGTTDKIIVNNSNDVPLNLFVIAQGAESSNKLQVRLNQSSAYSKDSETTTLYCKMESVDYRVFCGQVWYYKGTYVHSLYAASGTPGLYATEIKILEKNTDNVVYTLKASKRA